MNSNNIAPPRKGVSHGKKSKAPGTGHFWCRHIQKSETIQQHQFEALTEFEAASLALKLCALAPSTEEWKFFHECSTHRGYEIKSWMTLYNYFTDSKINQHPTRRRSLRGSGGTSTNDRDHGDERTQRQRC